MAKTEASVYRREDLTDPEKFRVCFAELRPERLALEEQLKDFRDNKTKYQQLRYLHYCSDCYRVERTSSPDGTFTHCEPGLFTAHDQVELRPAYPAAPASAGDW